MSIEKGLRLRYRSPFIVNLLVFETLFLQLKIRWFTMNVGNTDAAKSVKTALYY